MGRCVYGGIYEPDHPSANGDGFRADVAALTRELGVTVVRYPGGNFVSGYDWEDGIGPRGRTARCASTGRGRPSRRTRSASTSSCAGRSPSGASRWSPSTSGHAGIQEACDQLEYANHPGGTRWSDLRVKNGAADPYGVRLWCLGNEMDGPWQIGHKTAARVRAPRRRGRPGDAPHRLRRSSSSPAAAPTRRCRRSGRGRRRCSSTATTSSTTSRLHAYYEQHGDDRASFLASAVEMDHMIDSVVATADAVAARLRSPRRLSLSFDEWNVWYQQRFGGEDELRYDRPPALIEDDYSVVDAVVVGGLLVSLLRHCDRVRIACQAQLVNVIAPIRTEPGGAAWRQTIFDPFAATARHARGDVLLTHVDSPIAADRPLRRRAGARRRGDVRRRARCADGDPRQPLARRAADRSRRHPRLPAAALRRTARSSATTIPDAVNSASQPDRVRAHPGPPVDVDECGVHTGAAADVVDDGALGERLTE